MSDIVTDGEEQPVEREGVPDVLMDAVLGLAGDLELSHTLRRIVVAAVAAVDARYGALGVLGSDGALEEFLVEGIDPEDVDAIGELPTGKGLLGLLIHHPTPIRLDELAAHPDSMGFPPNHPPMHTFLGVPIRVQNSIFGHLYLTEKRGGQSFTARDERLLVALAAAAGVAIGLSQARAEHDRLTLLEERDRIGRDLHDLVIQRLFATGMVLQGARRMTDNDDVRERIERAVDELDQTIKEVRSTIFALHQAPSGSGLRAKVLQEVAAGSSALGFEPTVRFDGPIDSTVSDEVSEHVVAALRESLSNAARHSGATQVRVSLSVESGEVVLIVTDNGAGISASVSRRSGLTNLADRAHLCGGRLALEPVVDRQEATRGTRLVWRSPVGATAHQMS